MNAGATSRGPAAVITGINVTPLVDITLVLLIVFMVTAKLIVRRQALPLDLPKAASGEAVQELLAVTVDTDGRVEIDGQRFDDDDALMARIRSKVRDERDTRSVLQADGNVPHRQVMHALDLLRRAGVAKVAFAVMPAAPLPTRASAAP